jgi:hypothetical protein
MWTCGRPDPDRPGAGFTVLDKARHVLIFAGKRDAGAYNHHSQLTFFRGTFHAMWSNHFFGEDGPGQRVLHSHSPDGVSWSPAEELFPPIQPVRPNEDNGLVLTALRWVEVGERLFAATMCHENTGFVNPDRSEHVDKRDAAHPFLARKPSDGFCRELTGGPGQLGPILPMGENVPLSQNPAFVYLDAEHAEALALGKAVRSEMRRPEHIPSWDPPDTILPQGVDSPWLCEPTVYRAADGMYVMLLRDIAFSHRLYVSLSGNGHDWPPAVPTDIPDSPSLSTTLKLPDGTVLLVGNMMAPAFDNPDQVRHYGRDPLVVALSDDGYTFDRAFALRCGQHEWRTSQGDVRGRGGGAQYPSCVAHDGILYVQYSMGKEDICVSSVPLTGLFGN